MSSHGTSAAASLKLKSYKKSTELYLRALWGRGILLRSAAVQENGAASNYLERGDIYVPDEIEVRAGEEKYYRAAATHAALHVIYSIVPFEVRDLNLMQRNIVSLVEDLRVELLAIHRFPGLRQLWLGFHRHNPEDSATAIGLMGRLSRSVLDPAYRDPHHWVRKGKQLILDSGNNLSDPAMSLDIGLRLANDLGQLRLVLNTGRYVQEIVYRDDNRCLWQDTRDQLLNSESVQQDQGSTVVVSNLREQHTGKELTFGNNEGESEQGFYIRSHENPQLEYIKTASAEAEENYTLSEWDYRTQVLKRNWCALNVKLPATGSDHQTTDILNKHKATLELLRKLAWKLRRNKFARVRKKLEGDEIDVDQGVAAMVALRSSEIPDPRVYMQHDYFHSKNLAIFILLDLSESTNQKIEESSASVSHFMREAVLLLGETLLIADEKFAISGFSSNGRHEVSISKFKTFAEPFHDVRTRLTSIQGRHSTRLGAAIRYSQQVLCQQTSYKKLLLVITDGTPSDIDVFDQRYLEYDSWEAVKSLSRADIKAFCLNLDRSSNDTMKHIFGPGRFLNLQHVAQLPEALTHIYFKYARH